MGYGDFRTDEEYVVYVNDTLAPDLVAGGYPSTAEDLTRLASMINFGYASKDDRSFVKWLSKILIPDLKDMGMVETARDFETGIKFWRDTLSKRRIRRKRS